jgi:DNA replication ATP-dependent helicase Dna2
METMQLEGLAEEDEEDFLGDDDDLIEGDAQVDDVKPQKTSGSSDEFGDVDFDNDLAEVFETTPLDTTPLAPEPVASLRNQADMQSKASKPHANLYPLNSAPPKEADSGDEFGIDDDDDIFAADLEQVVSMYDTRPYESPAADQTQAAEGAKDALAAGGVAPAPVINLVDEESDEFGDDDIDVDEFAAAEVAATQVPATTVCNTYPSI